MYRHAKDLNEFNALCRKLQNEDDYVPPVEPEDDIGVEEPDEAQAMSKEDLLTKLKGLLTKYHRMGNEFEMLIRDPGLSDNQRAKLTSFDEQMSALYIEMYKYVSNMKTRMYGNGGLEDEQ